jgi:pyruvate dehydrogenase phosphatase
MAWAVFDGHAGWQTADLLEKQLLPFVRHGLNQVRAAMGEGDAAVEAIQRAVARAFVSLDDSIMKTALDISRSAEPLQDKVRRLTPGYAGSCALLSIYDPVSRVLHVACTGDSRAVLGRKRPDGTWEAVALSVDQTGNDTDEAARLSREHPGEENIVKNGRVLGMAVSRAFGDGRWKWPLELQQDLRWRFYGPAPLTPTYDVRTPPYLTAEPVMTATKIDPGTPTFLIMATDGIWDRLSNQQAVELVGKWLESNGSDNLKGGTNPDSTREPLDLKQLRWNPRFVEERTTVQDNNAAVHLVRNSLGGNRHELVAAQLAFDAPISRRLRDDMTVQVVFFGNSKDAA